MVADLAKWAFWRPHTSAEQVISRLARRGFGSTGAPAAAEAWQHWSEAIRDYVPTNHVPTNEDQYGPFRVGAALPPKRPNFGADSLRLGDHGSG